MLDATTPSVTKYIACRSRGITWVETGSGFSPSAAGDVFLHARVDIGEGADRARDGAGRDLLASRHEPRAAAGELGMGQRQLDAERGGLGMDAVRPPDGGRHLVLEGAAFQRGQERVHVLQQQVRGAHELHAQAGVEHVRRGHALVDEARVGADELGEVGEEGDDVVLHFALDGVDLLDVELRRAALVPDGAGGLPGNDAQFGERVAGMRLDLEPDAELGLGRPDRDHLGAAIARDHDGASLSEFG